MKIVFLGTYNETEILNGPEKFAKRLFDEMRRLEASATFVCYFQDGRRYSYWQKLFGRERIRAAGDDIGYRLGLLPMMWYLLRGQTDIVHVVSFERIAIVAFLLQAVASYRIVYTVHSLLKFEYETFLRVAPAHRMINSWLESFYVKRSRFLVFVSPAMQDLFNLRHAPKQNSAIIPHGIDPVFAQAESMASRADRRLSIVFLAHSRNPIKGGAFFSAMVRLCTKPLSIWIVGRPESAWEGIPRHEVNFIAPMCTEAFARFLSDKDVFVSASAFDSFSIAAAEAMGAGVVPVVTEETGMSYLIEDGTNGFVVRYGEETTMAAVIDALSGDPVMQLRISHAARKSAAPLTWAQAAVSYRTVYDRVQREAR